MSTQKLKQVVLVHSVNFTGPADLTLFSRGGDTLELDRTLDCVIAIPNPTRKRDTLIIPLTNIKSMTILTEAAEILIAEKEKPLPPPAPKPKFKTALGVTKFVKNDDGTIEEKQV
jgi:hypothetical protein